MKLMTELCTVAGSANLGKQGEGKEHDLHRQSPKACRQKDNAAQNGVSPQTSGCANAFSALGAAQSMAKRQKIAKPEAESAGTGFMISTKPCL